MSNPIFNELCGGVMPGNNIFSQLQQFRQQMQGKNPHEEITKLLQSGAVNQQQLNQAQQMEQQMKQQMKHLFSGQ